MPYGSWGDEPHMILSKYGFDGTWRLAHDSFLTHYITRVVVTWKQDLVEGGSHDWVLDKVSSSNPMVAFASIEALERWLDEEEAAAVSAAREADLSWGLIGNLLNRSKQAVWQRYSSPDQP